MVEVVYGTIKEVVELSQHIPEFKNPHGQQVYKERLKNKDHLILIARVNNENAGFKVGYAMDEEVFYSWMGAVLPKYRRIGLAKVMADFQEQYCISNGYKVIRMKTRNRLKQMLLFAIGNDFLIKNCITDNQILDEYRIVLEKKLS